MVKPLVLLLALLVPGCTSYRVSGPLPPPATAVRVSFPSPRDVVARSATGDSILLPGVRELRGTVVRAQLDVRTDVIRIRLGSAHGPTGTLPGVPDGAIAAVPRELFVRVEQRSFDSGKTLRVVGYIAGGVLLVSLAVVALAVGAATE